MKFIKVKGGNYLNIDSIEFIEVRTRRVYTISNENVFYDLSEEEMNILLEEINKK
jgi:hypothetical protein